MEEKSPREVDVLIIGAGLAGLCLARQLLLAAPEKRILMVDRQAEIPSPKQKVGEATVQVSGYYYSRVLEMEEVVTRAYFRMHLADRAGVLAQIGQVFADEEVSISSAIQKEMFAERGTAEFVVTTHRASDRALRQTLRRVADLDSVAQVCSFLRVF